MTDQDVLAEIRSLKSEVGTLSDQLIRLRYDDFKAVFVDQMRLAVGEEGKRSFQNDVSVLRDSSSCELKKQCMHKLDRAVEEAATAFMRDDLAGAKKMLMDIERLICGDSSACQDGGCSRAAAETVRKVRAILQVYEGLVERLEGGVVVSPPDRDPEVKVPLSPEEVAGVLGPLANAWRVKLLLELDRGDRSLSELGKALDLQTGHLQFHLRALIDAGFARSDRRRHLYSITPRGTVVLQHIGELMVRVGPSPCPERDRGRPLVPGAGR